MRGRAICSPDWLSMAAPAATSSATSSGSPLTRWSRGCRARGTRTVEDAVRGERHLGPRRLGRGDAHQLEADAVGIEEVDGLEPTVVDDAEGVDALASQPFAGPLERVAVV